MAWRCVLVRPVHEFGFRGWVTRTTVLCLFGLTFVKSVLEAHTKLMRKIKGSRISMLELIQPPLRKCVVFGEDDQTDQKKQNALQKGKEQAENSKHDEAPTGDHGKKLFHSWLHGRSYNMITASASNHR